MTTHSLRGKVALVTGGATGLGRMIAEGLLEAGAEVLITSRKSADAASTELAAIGSCHGITADLDAPAGLDALLANVTKLTDRVHILVNNAGRSWGASFETFPDTAWDVVMATNVRAPFGVVQRLVKLLETAAQPSDPARVINIGSVAGAHVERLGAFSYAASKAALHHLSRELAAELAPRHITVNTVVPGYFATRMTAHIRQDEHKNQALLARIPLGRLGNSRDIAGACLFLSSEYATYITGADITVDGGLSGCR